MTRPPSRRSVLRTCTGTLGIGGLAGCLAPSDGTGTNRSERQTETGTEVTDETSEPTQQPVESATPQRVDTALSVTNETDSDVTLTVSVRRDGEQVAALTDEARGRVGSRLDVDITRPGVHTVEASVGSSASSTFDWQIDPGYEGHLEIRITGPERVTFREKLSESVCENAGTNGDLPFSVSGAEDTFQYGTMEIRNDARSAAALTVSIAHDGTTFFECTFDLDGRQSVSHDAVTATAGTYAVTVDGADGGRTEYSWRVPAEYNWPKLLVVVGDDGDPLVGCGGRSETTVAVENPTSESQSVDLTLLRDEDPVDEGSVTVESGSTSERALSFPIGDFYTLRAATDAGAGEETLPYCYCYEQYSPTVTLGPEAPQIEGVTSNCE